MEMTQKGGIWPATTGTCMRDCRGLGPLTHTLRIPNIKENKLTRSEKGHVNMTSLQGSSYESGPELELQYLANEIRLKFLLPFSILKKTSSTNHCWITLWPWNVASWKSTNNLMIFPAVNILPSGKCLHNYEKSPFSIGKSAISMGHVQSFLYVYQIKAVKPSSFRDPTIDLLVNTGKVGGTEVSPFIGKPAADQNVMVWKFPKMELLLCLPGKSSKWRGTCPASDVCWQRKFRQHTRISLCSTCVLVVVLVHFQVSSVLLRMS